MTDDLEERQGWTLDDLYEHVTTGTIAEARRLALDLVIDTAEATGKIDPRIIAIARAVALLTWTPPREPLEGDALAEARALANADYYMSHGYTPVGPWCPECQIGHLLRREGKHGAFMGCSRYPECDYTEPLPEGRGATEGEGNGDGDG
jgi:hypothetical protein